MAADKTPEPGYALSAVDDHLLLPELPPLGGTASTLANPVDLCLAGKSAHTKRMTRSHMNRNARLFGHADYLHAPWEALRYHHVKQFVGYLAEAGYAPRTINAVIAAIRGVAQSAFNMYQLDGDDLARIRSVRMVRGSRLPVGRMVPIGAIVNLVYACVCDEGPAGARDAAIIGCLYIGGLRRGEAAKVT